MIVGLLYELLYLVYPPVHVLRRYLRKKAHERFLEGLTTSAAYCMKEAIDKDILESIYKEAVMSIPERPENRFYVNPSDLELQVGDPQGTSIFNKPPYPHIMYGMKMVPDKFTGGINVS